MFSRNGLLPVVCRRALENNFRGFFLLEMDYILVDNDEFRNLCFYEENPSKVAQFLLTSKDRLPKAISDGRNTYYLAKNDYLGFGYWNPSSYDPNVFASTEDKKGKTKILKEEINGCLGYLTAFYF